MPKSHRCLIQSNLFSHFVRNRPRVVRVRVRVRVVRVVRVVRLARVVRGGKGKGSRAGAGVRVRVRIGVRVAFVMWVNFWVEGHG